MRLATHVLFDAIVGQLLPLTMWSLSRKSLHATGNLDCECRQSTTLERGWSFGQLNYFLSVIVS